MIDANGFPALLLEFVAPMGRRSPRLVLEADPNAESLISGFGETQHSKLTVVAVN
jgi:hypothetical protein